MKSFPDPTQASIEKMETPPRAPLFELRITELRPHWRMAERVRDAVFLGLGAVIGEPNLPGTAMMVAGELVENVFRHADWDSPELPSFHVCTGTDKTCATLIHMVSRNKLRARRDDYARLSTILSQTGSEDTALCAFGQRRALLQNGGRGSEEDSARLGLLAIAAEGHTRFAATLDENHTLTMTATIRST